MLAGENEEDPTERWGFCAALDEPVSLSYTAPMYFSSLRERLFSFFGSTIFLYCFVAAVVCAVFFWVQAAGKFPDPDSFYHARMAALTLERGPVHTFPWLAKTVFADSYVDHHFLYHVLLIPFVAFLPTLTDAARISSLLFGILAVLGSALLLRGLGVGRIAFLAPAFFLFSNPLLFRLNLAKAPSVSLIALYIAFYAAARAKPVLLGFTAFLYVWLYDGWILLPVLVAFVVLAHTLTPERPGAATAERGWRWQDRLFGKESLSLLGATSVGIVLGHVLNPYFPENVAFAWLHIVRIGIIGFKETIGVGAEWYPFKFFDLLAASVTTFHLFALGAVAWFAAAMRARETGNPLPRRRVVETAALYFFALLALVFTVRSRRNVEYFVPFAVLAAVSAFDLFRKSPAWAVVAQAFQPFKGKMAMGIAALVLYFSIMSGLLVARDWRGVRNDFDNAIPPTKYAHLANWFDEHTPEGALIFHNDWDDFPYFFLHSTHNTWMVGLDPSFWYVKDPVRFQEWVDMTQNRITDRLGERILNDFGARYAFVDTDHAALKKAFDSDPQIRNVYQDAEGTIYVINEKP